MKVRYKAFKKPKSHVDSDGSFCRDMWGRVGFSLAHVLGKHLDIPGICCCILICPCHAIHRRSYWNGTGDTFVGRSDGARTQAVPLVCPIAVVWCVRMRL